MKITLKTLKIITCSLIVMHSNGSVLSKDRHGKTERKPLNILFLTADDLAYNSIGSFGCRVKDISPKIDKLASEGIRFTYAHINSAVCQPCRQSLLTGLYPHNNGAEGFEPIDKGVTTLPELMKKGGYINGILGKEIHHQPTEKFFWDFEKKRYPMRCLQNKEFGYIYNFWSDGTTAMAGDATGGLTWKAMVRAGEKDQKIADRVELYRHRVREKFYDLKNDPDCYNNLIDKPEYGIKIKEFKEMMLKEMKKYKDPAYEAFRDRDKTGAIESFMEMQRKKAKNTKSNVSF